MSASASAPSNKTTSRTAVLFAVAFLVILLLMHFLEPEFDPSWRMISEYELGRYGWLMTLAFFCWGGSVLALRAAISPALRTTGGVIGRWWLLLIGAALFGAGIFKTNEITDLTPSTINYLHTLCGAVVIMTFPIAATLSAVSLRRNPEWAASRTWLFWGTLLVWLSMFAFFGSIIVSSAINPSARRVGPEVYLGWPNRIMVAVYVSWLIGTALSVPSPP